MIRSSRVWSAGARYEMNRNKKTGSVKKIAKSSASFACTANAVKGSVTIRGICSGATSCTSMRKNEAAKDGSLGRGNNVV